MGITKYDPDRAASLIRATMGMNRVKQTALSKKLGFNRVVLNMFLNRRIDLLQKDIGAIFKELGIEKQAEKITELNNG